MNDQELLQAYLHEGSQAAFAQLVERHVALVYSAARRLLGSSHLAEDVTQQVFTLFARKAAGLRPDTLCSGWLYRTARHVASETLRGEARRRRREQIAMETMSQTAVEPAWKQLEPLLDDAMAALSRDDHDALVLRYFENLSLKEVATSLGTSEDAAQKRVSRALERLRSSLAVRGIALSAITVGAALSSGAVQPAPAGLAAATASAATTRVILQGLKTASAPARLFTAGVMIAALSIGLVLVRRQNAQLRREATISKPAQAETVSNEPVTNLQDNAELQQLRKEHLELLSLRGRLAQLTREQRGTQPAGPKVASSPLPKENEADSILFSAALTNRVPNGHTLVVGGWAQQGMRGYLLLSPGADLAATNGPSVKVQTVVVMAPDTFWEQIGWGPYKSPTRRSSLAGVLTPEQTASLLQALKQEDGAELSNTSLATGRAGERMGVGFSMADENQSGALMSIDFFPRLSADGQAIDVELSPSAVSPGREIHPALKAAGVTSTPSY